jgi:hypothetical protein
MRSYRSVTLILAIAAAVGAGARTGSAATYYVSPIGFDSNPGTSAAPWRTLQKAAAVMVAGDTALIANGEYPGGIVQTRDGTAVAPITFRAVNVGRAIVRGDQTANRDAIFLDQAHYLVLHGLTVQRANRAGIRISLSNFVTVQYCRFLNNGRWGIFTDYSDDLRLQYNECAFSALEHGIYVSNSGDRPIIFGNNVHDNNASGIQINADPLLLEPSLGKRGDGITENAIVAMNVVSNNGAAGGAAINLASVRGGRISNNLLFNNKAGGISGWDDGAGIQWGTKNLLIMHNTIYFRPGEGRYCVSLKNGSTGNTIVNNILHGGARGAVEFDNDSAFGSDYNLMRSYSSARLVTNEDTGAMLTLIQWRAASGKDIHSSDADPLFVRPATAPYDFHLMAGSPAIDRGVYRTDCAIDLNWIARPQNGRFDMGCYER